MARTKRKYFELIRQLSNVVEPSKTDYKKPNWNFGNQNPIILELGCGDGDYVFALANLYPNTNFVGVDIKGERIGKGAILCKDMVNVRFLQAQIENLGQFFEPNSISEIWITFADPQPNKPKKRLTSERFLAIYKEILVSGGIMHLKTDSKLLYDFTKGQEIKILQDFDNVYCQSTNLELTQIQTKFEKKYLAQNLPIYYLKYENTKSDNKNTRENNS